jgi:hypothetical protein
MAQTPEEFENQRRANQPTGKHKGETKGGNAAKPGGNRTNDKRPSGNDQRDERYDD